MSDLSPSIADTTPTIDASDAYKLREWADSFDVSVDELRLAIREVGPGLRHVTEHLSLN